MLTSECPNPNVLKHKFENLLSFQLFGKQRGHQHLQTSEPQPQEKCVPKLCTLLPKPNRKVKTLETCIQNLKR